MQSERLRGHGRQTQMVRAPREDAEVLRRRVQESGCAAKVAGKGEGWQMTTEISYVSDNRLHVEGPGYGWFTCVSADFNKQHDGVWNSRVFAFVPQIKFSDGTPVASYEQFN